MSPRWLPRIFSALSAFSAVKMICNPEFRRTERLAADPRDFTFDLRLSKDRGADAAPLAENELTGATKPGWVEEVLRMRERKVP